MTVWDIVKKLIGEIEPAGDSCIDPKRLENLRAMTDLVDGLLTDIDYVAYHFRGRHEDSIKQASVLAHKFLSGIELRSLEDEEIKLENERDDMQKKIDLLVLGLLQEKQKTNVLFEACENTARGQLQHPSLQSYANHSIAVAETAIAKVKK